MIDIAPAAYEKRRKALYAWMEREGIALVMFEDFEGRRDAALRWLSGHPGDALLFLSVDKKSLLAPWDVHMAKRFANVDAVIPYNDLDRIPQKALRKAAEHFKTKHLSRIEIPSVCAYPRFLKFVEELRDFDVICREGGADAEAQRLRAVKDDEELRLYRKVADFTNVLICRLEDMVLSGSPVTEADVALFIEAECRRQGCEGTGFDTLAAGAERSFGIHAFPGYTANVFGGPGLSILDFGVKYAGYTSDVTITFACPPLSRAQEQMITLVEKAWKLAFSMARKGASCRGIAQEVEAYFRKAKKAMPHGLGHGIGLEAHEAPYLNTQKSNDWTLQPGMVVTIEPGLYDGEAGGCRLENDVLITEKGPELLTASRIVMLP
ncbi:MAG: Xaa-Pro peptidase family protein [Treponema sp.]|jgi:Xaa-Pro dipeptidase|nr:Xaa-Pro peptidase family protein [Treponema sp.]